MGRRSRKRAAAEAPTRAERDAARQERAAPRPRPGRPSREDRPPAPWGSFPLSELLVLVGIVLMAWGLLSWSSAGNVRFGAGLAVAALGGLELSLREHLAGFRSHTTLLAAAAAFGVSPCSLSTGPYPLWALVAIAVVVFGSAFYGLRLLFKRRWGGLSFR
jgi:hypothetical protein